MVGDMLGNARLFRNKFDEQKGEIKSELVDSFFVEGGSIRYIHFHDFVDNFAFVSTMCGQIFGIIWDDSGDQVKNVVCEQIASTKKTITNIRTARCKDPRDEYYLLYGDTGGYIYVLRGKDRDVKTYKAGGFMSGLFNAPAVLALQAHPPNTGARDMKFGSLHKFSEVWSTCTNPQEFTCCSL